MNRLLLLSILGLFFGSCHQDESDSKRVIFAGEIVNPTSEQVVLFKGEQALDTAVLDENNRFVFRLDSVAEGLHHFVHRPESQYVYLESGDSLQIRLNTTDFDESLVFSGKGEEINNFILELFLTREDEEELISSYYYLEPTEFHKKIDSLKATKLALLNQIEMEYEISANASELARSFIDYGSHISMEAYPFFHRRRSGEVKIHEDLPASFYDYRKEINYNDQKLTYLRPYFNFMKYHISNLAYNDCKKHCEDDLENANRQLHFNQHKLRLIDSLVSQKELRDNLFRNVAIDYLLKHDTEENTTVFINSFKKYSENNSHNTEIYTLYQGIINMQPTKDLPDFTVMSYEGEKIRISDIEKGDSVVFYFWSGTEPGHFRNINKRIEELKQKYPDYRFVGLNMRTDMAKWKSMVRMNGLDEAEQYWTEDYDQTVQTLIVYDPNKAILSKNGKIIDAFSHLYRSF
ncbi:AhpC/TSA family protein [Muriicola jejuensis]|uniref:Redoxin domain-containing protein n=1 Tax=Muriicola jejuensis TaxID=504488 RepID=A0A6P0UJ44_9FLAO|nr:redoxin domain-containing protein [Muriicola jejuensis]NER11103.1 redoxin domain-containing protein [Muriicola jejuensis]SMP23748.1 AhpC/TSA family protein [Muriicola jejuensis]